MKRPLVQILVVVAIIQLRPLKTEVEKGSATTAIDCRLVGPKPQVKPDEMRPSKAAVAKGNQFDITELYRGVLNDGDVCVAGEVTN